MRSAWRFARRRGGRVSIAVVDTRGRLRGPRHPGRVPVGERREGDAPGRGARGASHATRLDLDGPTLDRLRAMITQSDNDSADAIYARVGDAGLRDVSPPPPACGASESPCRGDTRR